jgi:hypothetical protein
MAGRPLFFVVDPRHARAADNPVEKARMDEAWLMQLTWGRTTMVSGRRQENGPRVAGDSEEGTVSEGIRRQRQPLRVFRIVIVKRAPDRAHSRSSRG